MAVRTLDRGSMNSLLEVQIKSYSLYSYCYDIVMNPNIIDDSMFRLFGAPIMEKAGLLCEALDDANSLFLYDKDSAEERHKKQINALVYTRNLLSRIFILNTRKKLKERKLIFITQKIEEIQKLIRGMIKSDDERIKEFKDTNV